MVLLIMSNTDTPIMGNQHDRDKIYISIDDRMDAQMTTLCEQCSMRYERHLYPRG